MLVLMRKKDEAFRIGREVVVKVADIRSGGKVFLGIEAPKDISVHRQEVYDAIVRQQGTEPASRSLVDPRIRLEVLEAELRNALSVLQLSPLEPALADLRQRLVGIVGETSEVSKTSEV